MNEDSYHKEFVRQNLKLLTSPQFDREAYKRAYRAYYVEQNSRFGRPSPKELIELLIRHLAATMSCDEIVPLLDILPFFRETGEREIDKIRNQLQEGSLQSVLSRDQIESVKKVGAFEAVKEHHIEEVRKKSQREIAEIDQQIKSKRQEYAALPSILDQSEINEPDFDPENEERKTWWERFYLKGDPFPRKDGLSAISTDLYDEIIIKTEPFQRVLSQLKKNPEYLFNTGFLLAGDYGYGKTTFIDYLSHFLINLEILPLRITSAKGYADASGFADTFLNKLRAELHDETVKVFHVSPEKISNYEVEDQVAELCKRLAERKRGIVVFMDDYHKFRSHFGQIFEFLGTLQVLKDNLTREGAHVGFIVSGVPAWLQELKSNSQLMGFLDGPPIELPNVSADLVCEVFNRRIAAFCFDATPRKIKPDFVQNLVRDLGGEQGIRGCINRIVEELSINNLAIVDSPVEIESHLLEEVREHLEASSSFKASINKLRFEVRFKGYSNQQIAKCLELLVHICVQNGISEEDRLFQENNFYFQVLRDVGLIQKQRTISINQFCWNLSEFFAIAIQQVHRKFRLNLSDYLLKLYAYRKGETPDLTNLGSSDAIKDVKRFFAEHSPRIEKNAIQAATAGLEGLERLLLRPKSQPPQESDIRVATDALDSLTTALGILDGSELIFAGLDITSSAVRWEFKPDAPAIVYEAFQRLDDHTKVQDLTSRSHALKTSVDALVEISHIAKAVGEQLILDSDPLLHRPSSHTAEECELFQQIRDEFYSAVRQDHFEYMRRLVDYLELRFRNYFYLVGKLVFGDAYFSYCPQDIQRYAQKNVSGRRSFSVVNNSFNGLTRSQYRSIFTTNNQFHDNLVFPLSLNWTHKEWEMFTNAFAVENIKAAHNQIDSFGVQDKLAYRKLACFSEQITAAICESISSLINRCIYFVKPQGEGDAEYINVVCTLRVVSPASFAHKDGGCLLAGKMFSEWPGKGPFNTNTFQRRIPKQEAERVLKSIIMKVESAPFSILTQDLLDVEYIETHYRTGSADFVCILAWASHIKGVVRVFPWFGSSIAVTII